MSKVIIAYWSQTGNTQQLAEAIAQGVTESGKEALAITVDMVSLEDLEAVDVFALGCPAMGAEVLEESEMEPFVDEVVTFAKGKKIALFGSYGWGDGEWMRNWEEQMQSAGAQIVGTEGLICQEQPDEEALEQAKALGKELAALIS